MIAGKWLWIGALAATAAAGCMSAEERRVKAIQHEIDERLEADDERLAEIEDRYLRSRVALEAAKREEVAETTGFREKLLKDVAGSREELVKKSLERQLALATDPSRRLEVRSAADELEALYDELKANADRITALMVAARGAARDRQLARLEERRAELRSEVEERQQAFVAERRAEIAAVRSGKAALPAIARPAAGGEPGLRATPGGPAPVEPGSEPEPPPVAAPEGAPPAVPAVDGGPALGPSRPSLPPE